MRGVGEPISPERGREELVECQRHEQLLNVAFATLAGLAAPLPVRHRRARAGGDRRGAPQPPHRLRGGHATARASAYLGLDEIGLPFGLPLLDPPAGAEPFAFDLDSLVECRRRVYWQATRAGLGVARTNDLVLAVNEILTNSVRHGGGTGVLRIWQDDETLVCEVARPRADRRPARRPAPARARPDRRARPLDGEPALRPRPAALAPRTAASCASRCGAPEAASL